MKVQYPTFIGLVAYWMLTGCAAGSAERADKPKTSIAIDSQSLLTQMMSSFQSKTITAKIATLGQASYTDYYGLLLDNSDDRAFTMDGVTVSGVRTSLSAQRGFYTELALKYSSLAAGWAAAGVTDLSAPTVQQLATSIRQALECYTPRSPTAFASTNTTGSMLGNLISLMNMSHQASLGITDEEAAAFATAFVAAAEPLPMVLARGVNHGGMSRSSSSASTSTNVSDDEEPL